MSYPTEEEVLLRWRDLVLETDPDIIIGCGARAAYSATSTCHCLRVISVKLPSATPVGCLAKSASSCLALWQVQHEQLRPAVPDRPSRCAEADQISLLGSAEEQVRRSNWILR